MSKVNYRQIWEDHNGRKMPKGHHIHHIDGDRKNNHPDNLQCCSPEEHWLIHYTQGDIRALHGKFIQGASAAGKLGAAASRQSEKWRQSIRKPKTKGKIGKWIRTPENSAKMSAIRKGKNTGDSNPAKRPEVRKKISEKKMGNQCGLGNKSVVGLIWVNNGEKRMMVKPDKIPSGYVKGKKYAVAQKV